jgi:hypothetical protein
MVTDAPRLRRNAGASIRVSPLHFDLPPLAQREKQGRAKSEAYKK